MENHRLLRYLFWNSYINSKPCSGIFAENGDPGGRHVPNWSNMEVPQGILPTPKISGSKVLSALMT